MYEGPPPWAHITSAVLGARGARSRTCGAPRRRCKHDGVWERARSLGVFVAHCVRRLARHRLRPRPLAARARHTRLIVLIALIYRCIRNTRGEGHLQTHVHTSGRYKWHAHTRRRARKFPEECLRGWGRGCHHFGAVLQITTLFLRDMVSWR